MVPDTKTDTRFSTPGLFGVTGTNPPATRYPLILHQKLMSCPQLAEGWLNENYFRTESFFASDATASSTWSIMRLVAARSAGLVFNNCRP